MTDAPEGPAIACEVPAELGTITGLRAVGDRIIVDTSENISILVPRPDPDQIQPQQKPPKETA